MKKLVSYIRICFSLHFLNLFLLISTVFKVAEINELGDKRQALAKAKVERLARRRRRDIRDAYNDCVTAAAGKNPSLTRTPDVMIRVAERDARRSVAVLYSCTLIIGYFKREDS